MKIILIRHGKTDGNLKKVYLGTTDEKLATEGVLEIKTLTEQGFYPMVDIVFASPMKRAVETANIIYKDKTPIEIDELKERNFGDFEYKTYEELKNNTEYISFLDNQGKGSFGSSEDYTSYNCRTINGFKKCISQGKNTETIAVIAHGGTIMAIMHYLFKDKSIYDFQVANGKGFIISVEKAEILAGKNIKDYISL